MQRAKYGLVARAATAGVATQRRNYEYWGMHTSPRAQPSAQGDKLSGTLNLRGIQANPVDAMMLTGNGAVQAYSIDHITDRVAENRMVSKHVNFFNGADKYILDPVTVEECRTVLAIYEGFEKGKFWARLLKLFPSLKTPLDDATKLRFEEFYAKIIENAHDEAAVHAIAEPFVFEMFETKFISTPYWWRFAESLMDTMTEHHTATASFSGRDYGNRALRVVIERATKVTYNTMNDWNFASDDFTSVHKHNIGAVRAVHEAGYW